ncbi:hypothetical protein M0805_005120 [Coniferiporia weirii]|nr:hypothetical protein M0805_005120 [Coniferiporia weirii]
MFSRRPPLAVYSAKRRQRSISNPHPRPVPSSSPLKQLGEQDADLTVGEMSRRMMKRSRSSLKRSHSGPDPTKAASAGASPEERSALEGVRPAKKARTSTRTPLATISGPGFSNQNALVDEDGTVDMDLTSMAQLKTPVAREGPVQVKSNDATVNEEPDFLSPLPTSRTAKRVIAHRSNSNLRENRPTKAPANSNDIIMSSAPDDLASPFHSRPVSPNSSQLTVKKAFNKKLNRTCSVGTDLRRRATMRSFSRAVSPASNVSSPGFHRRPSLPNSQNNQKKENQDWLVPAQLKRPTGQKAPRRLMDPNTPFVREGSFFRTVPEACSTPITTTSRFFARAHLPISETIGDTDATPRLPLTLRQAAALPNSHVVSMIDESTPRARPMQDAATLTCPRTEDSLFPTSLSPSFDPAESISQAAPFRKATQHRKERGRVEAHLSEDSIFSSSLDFSLSTTIKQSTGPVITASDAAGRAFPDPLLTAPPSSPTVASTSSVSSDGDELRDMFSILGLDEDDQWFTGTFVASNTSHPATVTPPTTTKNVRKRKNTAAARGRNVKQTVGRRETTSSSISVPASLSAKTGLPRPDASRSGKKITPARARQRPTMKMKISSKPVQAATDSSDELDFLKSRGPSLSPPSFDPPLH